MLNKVMLIGNLGGDPEVRYTQGGDAVVNFTIATSESYKKDGEKVTNTEWHKIVGFGRVAEVSGEYLFKGSKVYIEGKIQTRKWEDRDGNPRYTTEIVMREMKMLGDKPADSSPEKTDWQEPGVGQPDKGDVPF